MALMHSMLGELVVAKKIARILLSLFLVLGSPLIWADDETFVTWEGAIRGYDPVAYFREGKPVKGEPGFAVEWNGAGWQFSSVENRDLFLNDPERYAPQFGGYCAYGMSLAKPMKVSTDPNAFTIVNGRLYLNHSLDFQKLWRPEKEVRIPRAEENWLNLRETPYDDS